MEFLAPLGRRAWNGAWWIGIIGWASTAGAVTYHVDPAGRDSNLGTSESPWATLENAARQVIAGDTVVVRAGRYQGFGVNAKGTADQTIAFLGESGATIVQSGPTGAGIDVTQSRHITVSGFRILGVGGIGARVVDSSDIRIQGLVIADSGQEGLGLEGGSSLRAEGIEVRCGRAATGIRVRGGQGIVFEGVEVTQCAEGGVILEAAPSGVPVQDIRLEKLRLIDNGGPNHSSLALHDAVNGRLANSVIAATVGNALEIGRQGGATRTVTVVNNTVDAGGGGWAVVLRQALDSQFFNNILLSKSLGGGAYRIDGPSSVGFKSDFNVLTARFEDVEQGALTLAQWTALFGYDSQSKSADRGVLFDASSYRLRPESPAIDAGQTELAPMEDIEGVVRPQNNQVDAGAYEYCLSRCFESPDNDPGGELLNRPRGDAESALLPYRPADAGCSGLRPDAALFLAFLACLVWPRRSRNAPVPPRRGR